MSDIDRDNQIVWSVSNPSGKYTLNVTSHPYVAALMYNFYGGDYKGTPNHGYFETHTYERNDFSHTLLDPFRAKQVWRMMVTVKEMKDGAPIGNAGSLIEARLRNKFPDCFQEMLTICDRTATSVQVINANVEYAKGVFESNKDILQ